MKIDNFKYMPHIDGLRCVAVMAVLLFHFGVPGLGGGYVGVDIFFVISGYLISSIIIGEMVSTGGFNFWNFYARRVRRILPALIATLVVTSVFSWLILTPADLVAYGKSLVASTISLSNLQFWSESGYFDTASQTKPLLHTWSLSVEEQFYLVWPALLYLCHRFFGRRGLFWGILAAGLLSFFANFLAVAMQDIGYKSDLFFLPQFRVFEFAIGALGFYVVRRLPPSRPVQEGMLVVGIGLIVYSIVTLEEGDVFPYVNAIAPCVGTLLLIAARDASGAKLLLSNPAAVWIGRISYSLYLTHWPVVVFAGQYMATDHWGVRLAVMGVLSLLTAIPLHYWVEVRFRHSGRLAVGGGPVGRTLAAAISCCALGAAFLISDGMTWRYRYFTPGVIDYSEHAHGTPAAQASDKSTEVVPANTAPFRPLGAAEIEAGKAKRFEKLATACNIELLDDTSRCFMDRPTQVLLFGNSHEPDAFNAFDEIYGKDSRVNLINFGTVNDCEVALGRNSIASTSSQLACDKRFAVLNSDRLIQELDVLVFNTHQGFDAIALDLWKILEIIKKRNPSIRVVAIGSYLQTNTDCATLYNRYHTYDACRRPEFVNYTNMDERAKSPIPQVHSLDYLYISKYELMCGGADLAKCAVQADGEPAFYDQHHLSWSFARYMGRRLAADHARELATAGLPVPASE
ncbi:MAG: acyltransferase family protein [Stenotrophomonas sp.]|uniref:acyltransferase family protein n=1 Tax=Stenotrophomonas sp. TaxID=69392 RepID=UPI003D6D96B9